MTGPAALRSDSERELSESAESSPRNSSRYAGAQNEICPQLRAYFLFWKKALGFPGGYRPMWQFIAWIPFFQISGLDYLPRRLEAFFLAFRLAFFFVLLLAFFFADFLAFFLAFFFTLRLAFAFFLATFFLAAFFFVLRLATFFFVARLATLLFAFFRVTLLFFTTLRLEAFLRVFFLVAIIFSVSGTRR